MVVTMPLRVAGLVMASVILALTLVGCSEESHNDVTSDATATTPTPTLQSTSMQTVMSTTVPAAAQTTSTTPSQVVTTETSTFADLVTLTFRLRNVVFDSLVSNSTLLASFKQGVKEAVVNEIGAGILSEHVVVDVFRAESHSAASQGFLSPGVRRLENATAVDVQVDVRHPEGANEVVLASLDSGYNVSRAVLSTLEQTPGMNPVLRGPVQIEVVRSPSRVARGQVWEIPVGDLGNGVGCQDGLGGTGFLMYSSTSVHTRFAGKPPHRDNADHFVCVKYDGDWKYDTNEEWVSFAPVGSDVLVAEVDFSGDTVSDLKGEREKHQGLEKGYADGDLGFIAEHWRGSSNAGEFTVTGSGFNPNEYTTTTTTSTTTTTTTTTSTTSGPRMVICPRAWPVQGQSCQGNSADGVWQWMADHSFGLGPTYHDTLRPDIDYSQVPHGVCFEFGCVSDWKYQQTESFATLQCLDGAFAVVLPSGFQQDEDHKCTWL